MWGVVSPRRNEFRRGLWFGWWVQGLLTFIRERETSDQSPDSEVKSYTEGNEGVEGEDEVEGKKGSESDGDDDDGGEKDDDDGDEESCERTSVGPRDNHPFILPEE